MWSSVNRSLISVDLGPDPNKLWEWDGPHKRLYAVKVQKSQSMPGQWVLLGPGQCFRDCLWGISNISYDLLGEEVRVNVRKQKQSCVLWKWALAKNVWGKRERRGLSLGFHTHMPCGWAMLMFVSLGPWWGPWCLKLSSSAAQPEVSAHLMKSGNGNDLGHCGAITIKRGTCWTTRECVHVCLLCISSKLPYGEVLDPMWVKEPTCMSLEHPGHFLWTSF